MRKLLLILISLILLFVPSQVIAQDGNDSSVETTTLNSDETINKDYFAFNERIEIFGTVNGDVYTAGGIVTVEGRINGDLIVAGGQVTISGEVTQDIRVGGGQVTITGKIGRNLTVGGGSVVLGKDASVAGSVVAGGGSIELSAPIGAGLTVAGGSVNLSNTVGGDVEAWVGSLRLSPNAKVSGNLTYWSTEDVSMASEAVVSGEVTKNTPARADIPSEEKILGVLTGFALFLKVLSLVSLFILGLLLIKFVPLFTNSVTDHLQKNPWGSLGIGFLVLILIPIVSVVLMITLVGAPIGLILLTLWGILLFVCRVFVIYFIGKWLLNRMGNSESTYFALLVGAIVYGLVTMLPIIGGLTTFFVTLFALGALFFAQREFYTQAKAKKLL